LGGHPGDPNASPAKLDEEEYVEPSEHERVDGKEVGGHDMRYMGSQECTPRGTRPPGRGSNSAVLQDPGNRAWSQLDAELDQLSLDAAVAQPRVLRGQTEDELGGLGIDRWPTGPAMGIGPSSGNEPTVPGEQRLGRHREAGPARAGEEATQRRQERTIGGLVGKTSDLASEHSDLVTQRQQFDLVGALRANHQDSQLQQASEREVGESPQSALHPRPPHAADGSLRRRAQKNSCLGVRSGIRTLRVDWPLESAATVSRYRPPRLRKTELDEVRYEPLDPIAFRVNTKG